MVWATAADVVKVEVAPRATAASPVTTMRKTYDVPCCRSVRSAETADVAEPSTESGVAATIVDAEVPRSTSVVATSKAISTAAPLGLTEPTTVALVDVRSDAAPVSAIGGWTVAKGPTPTAEIAATRRAYGVEADGSM